MQTHRAPTSTPTGQNQNRQAAPPSTPSSRTRRPLGTALAAGAVTAALAFTTTPHAEAANQVLMLNGIGHSSITDLVMANVLGGIYAGSGYDRHAVWWPAQARPFTGPSSLPLTDSVEQGNANLKSAIARALQVTGAGEQVIVVGLSAGSLVVDSEIAALADALDAPDKSRLTFVVIADANRSLFNRNRTNKIIGFTFNPPPDTPYNTTVVTAEYDGFADFPDRWWNLLAVANAYAGTIVEHIPKMFTDLSTVPASNVTVTTNTLGGVTTTYLIPAEHPPLVMLLPFLKPYETQLKAIIDTGYSRNDPPVSISAATTGNGVVDPIPGASGQPVVSPTDNNNEQQPPATANAPIEADGPASSPPAVTTSTSTDGATADVEGSPAGAATTKVGDTDNAIGNNNDQSTLAPRNATEDPTTTAPARGPAGRVTDQRDASQNPGSPAPTRHTTRHRPAG